MFPEKLRALRTGKGLSLAGLAKEMNEMEKGKQEKKNTGPQIGSWERGVNTPSYLEIIKLCRFFGVTPNFLIGDMRGKIDLNELFASNARMKFEGRTLTSADRTEIYGLIKAHIRGKYAEVSDLNDDDTDDLALPLD
ncbi:helix-turn-helix domain-containing protein [Ligilactobacillus salivarius]|uniref:helix-turn-helix domain-containing protein n=1 Tax=Ligilactobacillus salivarius TaxID=1624 RepID=UPI002B46427F|nr:helix-turn-helix transcriptional regulator [Ligilactobacillus salivarius]